MGGRILVESEPGAGSSFYIALPFYTKTGAKLEEASEYEASPATPGTGSIRSETASDISSFRDTLSSVEGGSKPNVFKDQVSIPIAATPVLEQPASPYAPHSRRILVVEDNIVNQKVAIKLLQKNGHVVCTVGDGVQAVETLHSNHEAFDVVLMDVQMPRMDGLEATRRIREDERASGWRRMPIIGLTAHAMTGYEVICFQAGMDGYLPKPFDIKQVLSTIQSVSASREVRIDVEISHIQ